MKKIWNKSTLEFEKAKMRRCPRCSGFGGCFGDEDGKCYLCGGYGHLWMSTGCTQAKYSKESICR